MTRATQAGYEAGFDAGERFAFAHRGDAERMCRPVRQRNEYLRGWWDGYCPRTAGWAVSARRAPAADAGDVVMEVARL